MSIKSFRAVFSRGTSLTDAWRRCGIQLVQPRDPPWHAWRDDGTLVLTVWRDNPDVGRWVQWHPGGAGLRMALRDPGSIAGESDRRLQKLRSYNNAVQMAVRADRPIIVLVLTHRRNEQGQYQGTQRGAAVPAEAWNAWIGEVRDGGNLPYSVVPIWQYPTNPFKDNQ